MSLKYTKGPIPEAEAACTRTLDLAEWLGDTEYQLRALRALGSSDERWRISRGVDVADEFIALAANRRPGRSGAADRMAGIILHYLGDQTSARQHLERLW